jgi:hypothetical protein
MMCRFPVILRVLGLLALTLLPCSALAQRPAAVAAIDTVLDLPDGQRIAILNEEVSRERVRLVLRLAEERLGQVKLSVSSNPSEVATEIENYNNLVKYADLYISSLMENTREQKMLYKVLEVTLREHLIGLKECEETLGEPYVSAIEPAIVFVRNCRTDALNTLFGSSVLAPSEK